VWQGLAICPLPMGSLWTQAHMGGTRVGRFGSAEIQMRILHILLLFDHTREQISARVYLESPELHLSFRNGELPDVIFHVGDIK